MHTTPSGTFSNEADLPRIPLPSVEDSCAGFLDWCGPLLDDAELKATRDAVAAFETDATTRALQAALTEYAAADGTHSWLDEFWRDRYLGRRDRIALNANFFFLFNDRNDGNAGTGDDQISRATALIAAALDHKHGLDTQTIPPTTRRGTPVSMDQHRYLFSTTRIPGLTRDGVRAPYGASLPPVPGSTPDGWAGASDARHIAVFARGAMHAVDVLRPDGTPHSRDEVAGALREVVTAAAALGRGQAVGSLTTRARPDWARSRAALLAADPGNEAVLDVVETALFCVALEDEPPADQTDTCKRLLAGDPGNRWFDKGVTFIVFPDGSAGFNGEHCLLDGTTIVEFIDAVLTGPAASAGSAAGHAEAAAPATAPSWRPVEFALTGDLVSDIDAAAKEFIQYDQDTATRTVSFTDFGSDRAKSLRISPDAFAQLAYQLAHRRAKGFTGATYESIATRHFHHGRTEAMRVVTPEILDFVTAMDDEDADRDTRLAALRRAAEAHVARAKECQAGDPPEQHLWELRMLARRRGLDWSPALYESPGWIRMRDDYLSTSAAPSVNIQYFGFGATSEHCIGVAYVLLPRRFNVHLSTPRSAGGQMTVFADRLAVAIAEMSDLLDTECTVPDNGLLTGNTKTDFSDIYSQPDPRRYYRVLATLDYQIPRRALPVLRGVLAASRRDGRERTVLDVCCSYGVNSALLHAPDPDLVAARYASAEVAALSPAELAEEDRRRYASRRGDLTVLGLDASAAAIGYATRAGLLAGGWAQDLESGGPSPELAAGIADVGLIISTGGVGYVGRPTFERLLRSLDRPRDLWLAVFVLRVFDYAEIASLLGEYGLVTENLGVTFRQRRFADAEERRAALHDVRQRGLDPDGKELDGWYHAECFLTRPAADAARVPARTLLDAALRESAA